MLQHPLTRKHWQLVVFAHTLKFEPPTNPSSSKRNRGRKVMYFNPPYSANVDTKIGAKFLQIIDTCFPPNNPLHKIFNRNTVKSHTELCPT